MTKVYSLQQAREFFLRHSTGACMCIHGDVSVVVDCWGDAVKFFEKYEVQ